VHEDVVRKQLDRGNQETGDLLDEIKKELRQLIKEL